jgi:hypothetical protein
VGTFTSDRKEYDHPPVPAEYDGKPSLAKGWLMGWARGIWANGPVYDARYKRRALQAAYEAGHHAAREQRRASGESVTG